MCMKFGTELLHLILPVDLKPSTNKDKSQKEKNPDICINLQKNTNCVSK